jgi:nitrilase
MEPSTIRVAAAQVTPAFMDARGCVAKAVAVIEEAGRHGARLVAFPETWMPGYPMWIFGAAGWDDARAKRAYARLHANAMAIPGPEVEQLCRAARRAQIMVVMGVNERDTTYSRGTLFNSLVYISAQGELLGAHRKLMPTHAERILWGMGDGSTLHVLDTPLGRVGGLICWEHWMPLARQAMHARGEQIHVAAWPDVPDMDQLGSRHYAHEGRCFVISVGAYMRLGDLPDDFDLKDAGGQYSDDPESLLRGGSGIIGPDGEWVAGPIVGREEIIYADIDPERAVQEQLALDVAGHYNRPDVFTFGVDVREQRHVSWIGEDAAGAR